jgi:hypothetical protein
VLASPRIVLPVVVKSTNVVLPVLIRPGVVIPVVPLSVIGMV